MSQPQSLISPYPRLEQRQANSTQSTLSSPPPTTTNQSSTSLIQIASTKFASASATPTPSSSSQLSSSLPSPSPSASSTTASPIATPSSSTPNPTSSSSPTPSSTGSNPQPSPTSTSASVQPTSSSSSTPDQQTSSSQSSTAPSSPTPVQTASSDLPSQSSSSPSNSIPNTSSTSVPPPSPSSEPVTNTFSSRPSASSQVSSQIIVITSTDYLTITDTAGGVHTLTSYVGVSSNAPVTTISAPGGTIIAQLHNGDTHPPGFFDNRGAVIGTFLTIGLIVLAGSAAIIWRLARFRRARLRARQEKDAELNINNFLASEEDGQVAMLPQTDDFQTIPLNHEAPQIDPSQLAPALYHQQAGDSTLGYLDDPSYLNMQEIHPVRFSHRTGRSFDLNTMNTEEWGRYVHNNFSNGGSQIFGDGTKQQLVRVDEEVTAPEGPPIIISSAETSAGHLSSFHTPAADSPPEIHTVEQETFKMVSPPQFALEDQIPRADQRLEPTILPRCNPHRPRSRDQDELSSLRDEEDYSRRILRVSNPDHEESSDHHSTTQS